MLKKIIIFSLLFFSLISCSPNYKKITEFSEASGICYMPHLDSFFVVWDEWEIQEIDSSWKKWKYLKFEKNYDLEAIVCNDEKEILLMIDESTGNILEMKMSIEGVSSLKNRSIKEYKIEWYNLNEKWIEWFTQISKDTYIISTQSEKENILFVRFKNKKFTVVKKVDFPYWDLSWLDFFNKILYIISDKNNKVYKYKLTDNKIVGIIDLPEWSWEWISVTEHNFFLADDTWKIIKYKRGEP